MYILYMYVHAYVHTYDYYNYVHMYNNYMYININKITVHPLLYMTRKISYILEHAYLTWVERVKTYLLVTCPVLSS